MSPEQIAAQRPFHHVDESGIVRGPGGAPLAWDEVPRSVTLIDYRCWTPVQFKDRRMTSVQLQERGILLKSYADLLYG